LELFRNFCLGGKPGGRPGAEELFERSTPFCPRADLGQT